MRSSVRARRVFESSVRGCDRRWHEIAAGCVAEHIRNLIIKAGLQGRHRIDQTLLLRGFADALRGPIQFGSFAGDALMKLGLLGTIIGFILMLARLPASLRRIALR